MRTCTAFWQMWTWRPRRLAQYFARLIERLARGGAELAAISAVTPHICIRGLEKISVLPLVNVIDVVGAEIRSRGFKRVALLGRDSS